MQGATDSQINQCEQPPQRQMIYSHKPMGIQQYNITGSSGIMPLSSNQNNMVSVFIKIRNKITLT